MRISSPLNISDNDRSELESRLRSTTLKQGLVTRAKIILFLTEGQSPRVVAKAQRVSEKTLHKWKNRFLKNGITGLEDGHRSGRPTVIDEKTVKISNDPNFADKVIDIVGLYMDPPNNALVLSVDENTQIQALDRTQPGLPLNPGHIGSHTHDYKRHGTTSLYASFNVLTGEVIGKLSDRTRSKEFLAFLKHVEKNTPKQQDLHIILDNLSAHKTGDVEDWLKKNPRVIFHFTPTSSSWLNAVEGWFSQLERRALYRGIFTSVAELKSEIRRFIKVHNKELAKPFKWTKGAEKIIASVERAKKVLPN